MDPIEIIGSTMGLGFVAGIRLYATVFALGLAIRLHWLHLGADTGSLQILAHPAVLIAAGIAYLAEFFADKIPWVDSVWDGFHTFIRPIGAAILAATVLGPINPVIKLTLVVLCGGVAFASHSSKAASRLVVNHSPEPFTNIALSLLEDAFVPVGVWLSLVHPALVFTLVLLFLVWFAWAAPKLFRSVYLQVFALREWLRGKKRATSNAAWAHCSFDLPAALSSPLSVVFAHASPIPHTHSKSVRHVLGHDETALGIQAAGSGSIEGLRNSIGYLVIGSDRLVFVARRMFRFRARRVNLGDIVEADWKRGLLMNRLVLRTTEGDRTYYVFKNVDIRRREMPARLPRVAEQPGGSLAEG